MKHNNIVLTGFMGTGKTTVSRLVSTRLGREMIDVDQLIEARENMSIKQIFEKIGEKGFRDLEAQYIEEVSRLKEKVISTGGGAVLREENISKLRRNGIIICLKATPETIYRNISLNTDRPLLTDQNPMKRIHELLEYREKYYRNNDAEINIDNLTPEQVADAVILAAENLK